MNYFWLFCIAYLTIQNTYSQTITSTQQNHWLNVGYQGKEIFKPDTNILNVKDFGAVGDGITDDQPAIQLAILTLKGRKGTVYFPPGNYRMEKSLSLKDSVTLKGASAEVVTLTFDFNGKSYEGINVVGTSQNKPMKIITGFHAGSKVLIVEPNHLVQSGDYIEVRQLNGAWDVAPASWAEHSIGKLIRVKQVVGNKLILEETLDISFNANLKPELVRVRPIKEVHIQCLTLNRKFQAQNSSAYNIVLRYAINSSVSGIVSNKSLGSHIVIENSKFITVKNNYISDAFEFTGKGTQGYGITLRAHAEKNLIENNIFKKLRHAMVVKEGAFHNVISYNYSIEPIRSEYPTNGGGDIALHGHYAFENLFEGNIVQTIFIDHYWGPSGPRNTFFRNRTELYGIIISKGSVTTSEQHFIYNEVTNKGLLYGKYLLSGSDHYQYGNNINGSLQTIDKNRKVRNSRYLSEKPYWWIGKMPWPSIGYPLGLNQHSNPARERYHQQIYAICGESGKIKYTYNTFTQEELKINIYPNPVQEDVEFQVETMDIISSTMNVKIFSMIGKLILSEDMPVTSDVVTRGSINLPSTVPNGTYLMRIECDGRITTKKFFKQ